MANMDMDTDGPPPTPPPVELIDYFDLTPSAFPFRTPKPHEIDTRRAQMSDQLIFDILLSRGGIKQPDTLYPPSDPASLQRLLDAISNSTYDGLKNDCLVYFLLKWHGDGREAGFADELAIPPQFVALTDAYWHLDSGVDVQRAVHLLSDARVNREHSSKIIQALNLTPNPASLVVQFVQVVKPVLVEPPEIEAYGLALVKTDFNAAWAYQRTFAEGSQTRELLLRRIVESCVAPVRQQQVLALYTVPFTPYERSTIQNIALIPSSSSLPSTGQSILADVLVARLIQAGQLSKAILMDRRLRSAPGVPPASDARKGMIDDALAVLPSVEKLVLDDQIAALPPVPATKKAAPAPTRDVSMSWEEIPPAKSPAVVEKEKPAEKPVSAVPPRKPRTSYGSPAQPVTISGRKSSAFAQNNVPPSPFAPPAASSPKPSAVKPTSSYFGQSTPAPAASVNENPFANSSKPPANSLFGSTSASASGTSKAPRLSFGTTPLAKSTASTFGASTSKPAPVTAFGSSLKSSVSGFPLNASRAVSASRAPNAFFNPPPPPPELKRPALEHQDTDDIDAFLAGSAQPSDREISPVPAPAPATAPVVDAFSELEEEEEPEPEPRPKRKSSAASKIPVARPQAKTRRSTIKVQHREPPSPSSSPPPRKRTTRARKARMSIPGAFGGGDTDVDDDGEGEEEEEEKDEVAPLPEVPSPVKRRGTRSSVGVGEPIRRSSRLSVASSSPEPVSKSPVKGRRKTTRASGAGEGKGKGKEGGSGSAGRGRGRKR